MRISMMMMMRMKKIGDNHHHNLSRKHCHLVNIIFVWNIFEGWCVFCPTLKIYFDDSFSQIDLKQNLHFAKSKGQLQPWDEKVKMYRKSNNVSNFTPTSTNVQNGRQQERFRFYGSTCCRQRILASTNSEVHSRLLHWVKMQPFSSNKSVCFNIEEWSWKVVYKQFWCCSGKPPENIAIVQNCPDNHNILFVHHCGHCGDDPYLSCGGQGWSGWTR